MPDQRTTADSAIDAAHAKLNETFRTGRTKSLDWRMSQLQAIRRLCVEQADAMAAALLVDMRRPHHEALLPEVAANIAELDFAIENLADWMRPERVSTPLLQQPGWSEIVREPKGVVLVISPWNFPMLLGMQGVVTAVVAGNCCLFKPSEVAQESEKLMVDLIGRYLDPEAIIAIKGGVPESTALLKLRWDHIMFTGNGVVARVVARAAAEHLTPLTLELGGKSPTLVLPGADLKVAARRILFGKFVNSGQICIAPDYMLVHKDVEQQMVDELRKTINEWYGTDPQSSASFGRMVADRHFDRVKRLLDTAGAAEIISTGTPSKADLFIPPTLVREPKRDAAILKEEIFGPILPILRMGDVNEMIAYVNAGDKPLAMYVFGSEREAQDIIAQTSSGGVCVNDALFQVANPHLPFGGVGESGMGKYHGKHGFEELSHCRAVLYRKTVMDLPQRYPPYTASNLKLFQRIMIGPIVPPALMTGLKPFISFFSLRWLRWPSRR